MDDSRSAPAKRMTSQAPDPLIGRVINDRYRIINTIARGGMGKVYRAEQQPLGRLVALKVLSPSYTGDHDPEFHKRFFLEASIASKLTHPNTVTIFDYGKTEDDIYYIAMELLEGRTLYRVLREEGALPLDRALHVARQVCRSLREAHGLGVVHRDLKPANIYLVQHGDERDVVKVLDFGLVKNLEDKGEELTKAGLFMGSPKYMAPEQIRGERADARVDIYALGVILYEALTGKPPFDRPNSVNILMAHIQEDVPSMSATNPRARVPPQVETLVRKCMAKSREARFSSMEELLSALKLVSGVQGASGERSTDFSDLSRSVEIPLSLGTLTDTSTFDALPSVVTPHNAQMAGMGAGQRVKPGFRSRSVPIAIGLVAVAVAIGGIFVAIDDAPVPAAAPSVKAKPLEQPAEATRTAAAEPTVSPLEEAPQAAPPLDKLLVSLRSTPPGAMVIVAGKEYGPTPTQVEWTGAEATIGSEITFRFQRKGFRDLTVTRQVRGSTLTIDAPAMDPIEPSPPTRRAPEPAKSSANAPTRGAPY